MKGMNNCPHSCSNDGSEAKTIDFQDYCCKKKYSVMARHKSSSDKQHLIKGHANSYNGNNKYGNGNNNLHTSMRQFREVSKVGSVNKQLYWRYVKAGTTFLSMTVLIISIILSHGYF